MKFLVIVVLIWAAILGLELLGFFWLAVSGLDAPVQFYIFYTTVGVGIPIVIGHEIAHQLKAREEKFRLREAEENKRSFSWRLKQ